MNRTNRRTFARTFRTSRAENSSYHIESLEGRLLLSTQQLLVNPSFTNGTSSWVLSGDFWAGTTLSNWHTSPGYAAGGVDSTGTPKNNASGSMYQQFAIPANATSVSVNLWTYITTQETSTTTVFDTMSMDLLNASGALLTNVTIFSNLSKSSGYVQSPAFNISQYAGQTVRLRFLATTDQSNTTVFRIDDVAVNATTPDPVYPTINSVSPNPVTGSNSSQSFTINGSNFQPGCTVTLRDLTASQVFPNRTIQSQTSSQIIINPDFTTAAHQWSVEVINPGDLSSGQFNFSVVAPVLAPTITSLNPSSPVATGSPQPFTITGTNLDPNATVTLHDVTNNVDYPNRAVSSRNGSTQITINPNFGNVGNAWYVEVINPGPASSPQFTFTVAPPNLPGTISGVDVSHYQGAIDWTQVHLAGKIFAFVKATEGADPASDDPNFAANMQNGESAGILMGAYDVVHPELGDAVSEAKHFVSVAGPFLKAGFLEPVIDVEFGASPSLSTWVGQWISEVNAETGLHAIIYANASYAAYLASLTQTPLWIADPASDPPQTSPWTSWSFWQLGATTVAGVSGPVDTDAFNGNSSTLQSYVIPSTGSISGSAFGDLNNDGVREAGEPGLSGFSVYLDANQNGQFDPGEAIQTTDGSGAYVFANLAPGDYVVREVPQSGYALTTKYEQPIRIVGGQTAQGPAFGNVQISTVTMNLSYFLTLTRNFGQPGTFATGDLNGDGTVNLADLLLLTRNFGHALPAATTAIATPAGSASVPGVAKRRV